MGKESLRNQYRVIKKWEYKWTPLFRGYTDKILYINVSTTEVREKDVPLQMKEKFIGGQSFTADRLSYGQ